MAFADFADPAANRAVLESNIGVAVTGLVTTSDTGIKGIAWHTPAQLAM